LSYGAPYSGPIGVIIDPTFNLRKYSSLPFASTLNGSCTSVCPVKINIHEQIYKWRQIIAERHQLPFVKQEAMRMRGQGFEQPKGLPHSGGDCRREHRASAAIHVVQPVERLGPAPPGTRARRHLLFVSGISRTEASDERGGPSQGANCSP
jgi:L-lactate utilization protein LutB